ncbi:MAG TPA: AAA family ATPase, partial [Anaerolineaceae bacterium]|nr:AAA family ATPase [Anaerolineaceae bacterium]
MADFLIQTKFQIPPLRQNLIARDHLVARLDSGQPRLTLFSAPAGFGKTTLAVEWSQKSSRPFAWVSLDADDNDPLVFITYLVTALRSVDEGFSACLPTQQWPEPHTNLIPLMAAIINQAATSDRHFYLVLDDYQEIQNPKHHELVSYLLEHLPPQMHLVILSRSDPTGLPLVRLRSRNELFELRSTDLRFTLEETVRFLEDCMSLSLTPDEVTAIDSQVEGWVAGLQLVALSVRRPITLEKVMALAASEGHVGEYLLAEVLDHQPPEIRRFLLHTSILRHVCGELAESLTGMRASQALLHRLEQANLFIFPLDDDRRWYRYHPLFLQLLRDQLWTTCPAHEIASLYEQAGNWFSDHDMFDDAIHHSIMGEHYELAAGLIESHYDEVLWKRGEAIKLRNQFAAFP